MTMGILLISQQFAAQVNLPPPASLIAQTDPATLQIASLITAVSRDLRQDRSWPQQKKTHSFTTTTGRTRYPLPIDFFSALLETEWNRTTARPLLGPMTDAGFNQRLYGAFRLNSEIAYRIFGPDFNPNTAGGQFNIDPAPASGEILSFDYVSSNLFQPPDWTPSTVVAASSYRNANGLNFFTTAGGTTSTVPPAAAGVDGTVTWTVYSLPYEGIFNNLDSSIFDDDVMILGLITKWYQMKGLGFEALLAEYKSKLDTARNRWVGSYVGSFNRLGGDSRRFYPSTPGGWSF